MQISLKLNQLHEMFLKQQLLQKPPQLQRQDSVLNIDQNTNNLISTIQVQLYQKRELRRFPFMQLDETVNQTKAIKKAQAKAATEGISLKYNPLITKALGKLKRVRVKIPFAEKLIDVFPDVEIMCN